MKKFGVSLLVLLVLMGLLLCSCGKNDEKGNDGGKPTVDTVDEANAIDLSNYTIIRSDSASADEKSAAVALRTAIKDKCGYQLDMKTDFGGGADIEIVVGQTKRGGTDQLSKAAYVIEHSEKGFLIAGGSETATIAAVNFFIENLLSPSGALCKADFKYSVDNSPVFGDKTYDEIKVFVGFNGDTCSATIIDTYKKMGVPASVSETESNANIVLTSDPEFNVKSIAENNWGVTVENGILYIVGRDSYDVTSACSYVLDCFADVQSKTTFEKGVLKMDKKLSKEEFYKEKNLTIYPEFPDRVKRDYMYSVSVTQGDKTSTLPVYNHCQDNPHWTRDNIGNDKYRRFSMFAFSGEQVRVDVKVGCDFESYTVMPSAKGFKSEFKDGVISVYLDKPEYFAIRLDNDNSSIISILADYPEYPLDIPAKDDPNVLWISGVQEAESGSTILTKDHQIVYIEPGAVFVSRIKLAANDCKILGRGAMVDPYENFYKFNSTGQSETAGVKFVQMAGERGLFDGPVLLDAHCYNFNVGKGNTVRNGKALSVMITSDGLQLQNNSVAERCFVYVGDNGTVFQGENMSYKDITIGTTCGAIFPQGHITNASMENIYIFRADEGIINNYWNGHETKPVERKVSLNITGLYADDCVSVPWFFKGRNMGRAEKIINITNATAGSTRGADSFYANSANKTFLLFDTVEGAIFSDNYTLNIKNLYVNGSLVNSANDIVITTSGSGAQNNVNISSDGAKVITSKKYQVNFKNDLNVYIGELPVYLKNAAVVEGNKIYLPADEIKTSLRATGDVNTVEKNGIAYAEVNDLVASKLAASVKKEGNAVVLTPVAKKGNLLLADSGDIPYYTEASAFQVDMTARVEDGDTVYTLFNITGANAGIKRDLTNELKMYGAGKYELKFDLSGNGSVNVKAFVDSLTSTKAAYNQSVGLSSGWKTVSVELDVSGDMSDLTCYSFSVTAVDAGISSFEIMNITLKKIG